MEEDIELVLRCRELHDVATAASQILNRRLATVADRIRIYTFKSRLKTPNAILSKVKRKREEGRREQDERKQSYGPEHVTDAWGCRYVTLYQSQIPPTVKGLLAELARFNAGGGDNELELLEVIIFTNRPENDPLSITSEVISVLRSSSFTNAVDGRDVIQPPENRKSAYSSVHLVFGLPIETNLTGRGQRIEQARFEVQVRDIFEEGWGEIQHDLIYSGKDRVVEELDEAFGPLWQPHLNALKTFVDGCSQHASIIKQNYELIRHQRMPSLETRSATSREDDRTAIIGVLQDQVPAAVISTIELAYDLIIEAQAAEQKEAAESTYLASASKFAQVIELLGDRISIAVPTRFNQPVGYFLRLELANSCFFSGQAEQQRRALKLYGEIEKDYPDDPTVKLRHAFAEASMHKHDTKALIKAQRRISECISLIDRDPLTGRQHWIVLASRVLTGYISWLLSCFAERDRDFEAEVQDLKDAVVKTEEAYRLWTEMESDSKRSETHVLYAHKALSNLLYFSAKLIRLRITDDPVGEATILRYLQAVDELNVPKYREYYKTIDNKMHALAAIGRWSAAKSLAKENVTNLRRRAELRAGHPLAAVDIEAYLDEDEIPNFRAASAMLADVEGAARDDG